MLNEKGGGRWQEDWLGSSQLVVSNCPSLSLYILLSLYYFPFLFCFFKLPLSQPTSFTFYFDSFPHPTLLAVIEWLYAV